MKAQVEIEESCYVNSTSWNVFLIAMEDKLLIYGQESPWTNKGVLSRCPFPPSSSLVLIAPASRASFCLLFSEKKNADGFVWMCQAFEVTESQTLGLINLMLAFSQTGFRRASICLLPSKPLIIALAVLSTRLLGLSSKLYPSNMPRMLNKDFSRFK